MSVKKSNTAIYAADGVVGGRNPLLPDSLPQSSPFVKAFFILFDPNLKYLVTVFRPETPELSGLRPEEGTQTPTHTNSSVALHTGGV